MRRPPAEVERSVPRLVVTLTVEELDERIERAVAKALTGLSVARVVPDRMSALPANRSRQEAAKHAGVSKRTLDRAISTGELQTAKHGRRRLIPEDALERWIGLQRRTG